MEKVSDNYVINNTDKIAVVYVNSETAPNLSGIQLGFKTISKQGGLQAILTNTSQGQSWSPALVFNYLPLSKAAISGNYEDLNNKPTIPSAVTENTVTGWGFTKNTGTYSKPANGIPESDLTAELQSKLQEIGNIPIVQQTETTVEIAPNVLNIWGEVTNLNITFAEAAAKNVNEYMFQFTSGETATTLELPSGIKWLSTPNIQPNKTYQVSIINNLGVIGEFSNE